VLLLCRHGIPFDVAVSLPERDRIAWTIAEQELDGNVFDWKAGRWRERPSK
jgi:hypothetical protein